jgi:multidrug resistance efflux pump
MPGAPLFADDNSSYRRAARRAEREERVREERRREIMATLRRLKEEAGDTAVVAERERARRHADLLERYPPLF